jgi:Flp pilus assembly pilin Flp
MKITCHVRRFIAEDSGATLLEYVMMIGFVAAVVITAARGLGTSVSGGISSVAGSI